MDHVIICSRDRNPGILGAGKRIRSWGTRVCGECVTGHGSRDVRRENVSVLKALQDGKGKMIATIMYISHHNNRRCFSTDYISL